MKTVVTTYPCNVMYLFKAIKNSLLSGLTEHLCISPHFFTKTWAASWYIVLYFNTSAYSVTPPMMGYSCKNIAYHTKIRGQDSTQAICH